MLRNLSSSLLKVKVDMELDSLVGRPTNKDRRKSAKDNYRLLDQQEGNEWQIPLHIRRRRPCFGRDGCSIEGVSASVSSRRERRDAAGHKEKKKDLVNPRLHTDR